MRTYTFVSKDQDAAVAVLLAKEAANRFFEETLLDTKRLVSVTTNEAVIHNEDGKEIFVFIITLIVK